MWSPIKMQTLQWRHKSIMVFHITCHSNVSLVAWRTADGLTAIHLTGPLWWKSLSDRWNPHNGPIMRKAGFGYDVPWHGTFPDLGTVTLYTSASAICHIRETRVSALIIYYQRYILHDIQAHWLWKCNVMQHYWWTTEQLTIFTIKYFGMLKFINLPQHGVIQNISQHHGISKIVLKFQIS